MLIYSHIITPRLQYIVDFLGHYFGQSFFVTTDWQFFHQSDKPKIKYSLTSVEAHAINISPTGLLNETGIKKIEIDCFDHDHGYKAFFRTEGHVGFDLFSAIFYLLSRYEEYLPHQKDMYGRYAYENSLAYKNKFLHLPLINIWLEHFRSIIHNQYPHSLFSIPHFQFLPTYDIDIAWSYKQKGLLRNTGGAVKSMMNGQWSMIKQRIKVLTGHEQDPFDSYAWLNALHQQHKLSPLYFFHVGQKRNQYDKNIATTSSAFQRLVQEHAKQYTIGLHPSWHSSDDPAYLTKEKAALEAIAQQPITISRQHYIRFTLPYTFRQLISAGITDEYSMGYGSINGFRASIASSFYWYDIEKEEKTSLLLHPFCFMDANAFFEQKLSPEKALEELMDYYYTVKKVNGTLIIIWHNNFLGTDPLYRGWREVYQQFIIHTQHSYSYRIK